VTLRHFEAGWGWEAQLRHLVTKKYRQDLAGLVLLDPGLLARLFRGELLPDRPYATVKWVLRLVPFRPLELYLLYDVDPELGSDLRILYARKSLAIPTEDAYVFAWDYVALLARYGRGSYPLVEAGPGPEWLPFRELAPVSGAPLENVSLKPREELVRRLSPEVVQVALYRLDSGEFQTREGGWQVVWPLLGDLALRLRGAPDRMETAFDSHGGRKYAPEFLMSFAWLYLNGLLRECRQVEPSLPRLSRYL
jgi:hypothetical protein